MKIQSASSFISVLALLSVGSMAGCGDGETTTGSGGTTTTTTTTTTGGSGGTGGTATTGGSGGTGGTVATGGTGGTVTTGGTGGTGGTVTTGGTGGTGGGMTSFLDISFDDAGVTYTLTGFGGDEDSTVVVDPTDATNMVGKVIKQATAELWAGVTVSTGPNFSIATLPFSDTATKMSVRVWSPDAGIEIRLKVEDAADPTHSCETVATTTMASKWETLEFDFKNQAPGTAALNLGFTFNKVSVFFNFGVTGAMAGGAKTYYFDNVKF